MGVEVGDGVFARVVQAFVLVERLVFEEGPGHVLAGEQAQQQGEDQGQQASGLRARARNRLSGGVQRGGVAWGIGHCENIQRTNSDGKKNFLGVARGRGTASELMTDGAGLG
jgi:hypothetical protein